MSKKLKNAFFYVRKFDLRKFKKEVLSKYNLEQAIYIYIGSSKSYNMRARSSEWRYHIRTNNNSVALHIREFISNLKEFYKIELNLSESEIDDNLYYNNVIFCSECESLEHARQEEEKLTNEYKILDTIKDILQDRIILLSDRASSLTKDKDTIKLKNRKSKEYENKSIIQFRLNFNLSEDNKYTVTSEFLIDDNKKILSSLATKSISKN